MPLPNDEKLLSLAQNLIDQFDTLFGLHPGFRPAHAKGTLLTGVFKPTSQAKALSRAPHFDRQSTPVSVRFSDATGIPVIPDNDPNAAPHGMAVRFHLAERVHTDIIAQSADCFPTRTGEEFLEFLRAVAASADAKTSPTPIEAFLGAHPAALAFVQISKPAPVSFATETYFGITAMHFLPGEGSGRFGRYRIVPENGNEFLDQQAAASKDPNYLFDEIAGRAVSGPIRLNILAQLANEGDEVNDSTIHWPEDRELLELGTLELTEVVPDSAAEQKYIIFDPIPRVDGIEPSEDPLLELRAAVYLMSGRRRRAAAQA